MWQPDGGEERLIEDMREELEDYPQGGPMVVADADDRGVYSLLNWKVLAKYGWAMYGI